MNESSTSNKLGALSESASVAIADKVRSLEAAGKRIIRLQTGDPDFQTPQEVIAAAQAAMQRGATHYSLSRGLLELRQAIAVKLRRENGLDYDPLEEILVTHGGVHAVYVSIAALAGSGDEVLILDPSWMPYAAAASLVGAVPVRVASGSATGFRPIVKAVRKSINSRTKMLVVNTPCNPTGVVLSKEELSELALIALEHNLFVLADEVYEKIVFPPASHHSMAAQKGMRERTITVNSLSKTYAMTGWRIGYLAGAAQVVRQILKVVQYTITSLAPYSQFGALCALSSEDCSNYTTQMRSAYANRRQLALQSLADAQQIKASIPEGTFYLMLDVRKISASSQSVATELLEKQLVATVPGIAYGACAEGFLRLSLTVSDEDLRTALDRIRSFSPTTGGV